MKSTRPKVLHEVCGRPMLWFVLRALRAAGFDDVVVVTSPDLQERIADFDARGAVQDQQRGTGDAVKVGLAALEPRSGCIIVTNGDMPLISEAAFAAVRSALLDSNTPAAMALLTVTMPLPSSFGRIVREGRDVSRIVEARDATAKELEIDEMNAGVYAFDEAELRAAVPQLRNDNAQGEFYLTDLVDHFVTRGKRVRPVTSGEPLDAFGINDRVELARARREMNARLCDRHMRDGVTIVDPDTTYLEPELTIGRDTVLYPNTTIARLSEIGERCTIGPDSHLSNVRLGTAVTVRQSVVVDTGVADGTIVGPFAHVRSESNLGRDVRVGNFVEIKKSELGDGVKAGHLAYLGDATVGEQTNVGAGTITCNYDGRQKNVTVIGSDAFIGSNSSLVAPVSIGDGALTGAGSVVTHDVPPGERVAGNPARPLPKK
ncbi:MAG: bifunctional UDP-N-acetylglucosamine diphosphorylase/glucosamine-1-phosphate N-acetyltransferase GlmU [Candidatus Eremiobacteraeota bacterium]|nr:bifunctional UDP-N-acetylglucosamine diphosphorylase/glucosamine-1-phosphate N-acetyltransferase GlmU [Candidatus Eremiobacteraeota bacterium]